MNSVFDEIDAMAKEAGYLKNLTGRNVIEAKKNFDRSVAGLKQQEDVLRGKTVEKGIFRKKEVPVFSEKDIEGLTADAKSQVEKDSFNVKKQIGKTFNTRIGTGIAGIGGVAGAGVLAKKMPEEAPIEPNYDPNYQPDNYMYMTAGEDFSSMEKSAWKIGGAFKGFAKGVKEQADRRTGLDFSSGDSIGARLKDVATFSRYRKSRDAMDWASGKPDMPIPDFKNPETSAFYNQFKKDSDLLKEKESELKKTRANMKKYQSTKTLYGKDRPSDVYGNPDLEKKMRDNEEIFAKRVKAYGIKEERQAKHVDHIKGVLHSDAVKAEKYSDNELAKSLGLYGGVALAGKAGVDFHRESKSKEASYASALLEKEAGIRDGLLRYKHLIDGSARKAARDRKDDVKKWMDGRFGEIADMDDPDFHDIGEAIGEYGKASWLHGVESAKTSAARAGTAAAVISPAAIGYGVHSDRKKEAGGRGQIEKAAGVVDGIKSGLKNYRDNLTGQSFKAARKKEHEAFENYEDIRNAYTQQTRNLHIDDLNKSRKQWLDAEDATAKTQKDILATRVGTAVGGLGLGGVGYGMAGVKDSPANMKKEAADFSPMIRGTKGMMENLQKSLGSKPKDAVDFIKAHKELNAAQKKSKHWLGPWIEQDIENATKKRDKAYAKLFPSAKNAGDESFEMIKCAADMLIDAQIQKQAALETMAESGLIFESAEVALNRVGYSLL